MMNCEEQKKDLAFLEELARVSDVATQVREILSKNGMKIIEVLDQDELPESKIGLADFTFEFPFAGYPTFEGTIDGEKIQKQWFILDPSVVDLDEPDVQSIRESLSEKRGKVFSSLYTSVAMETERYEGYKVNFVFVNRGCYEDFYDVASIVKMQIPMSVMLVDLTEKRIVEVYQNDVEMTRKIKMVDE